MEIVVWTNFLHQLVVDAQERDKNADDFEGFGTKPGSIRLRVLSKAGLRWIIQTGFGLLRLVGLLVLHPTVEGLGVFGRNGRLLRLMELDFWLIDGTLLLLLLLDLKLYHFRWRNNADRYVAKARGVVPEVDCERTVDMVDDLTSHQQVKLQGLDTEVKVPPSENLLGLHGSF